MAKEKKIKKSIESLQKRIEEHQNKINEYKGEKDYLIDYWEKEIQRFEEKKRERKKALE